MDLLNNLYHEFQMIDFYDFLMFCLITCLMLNSLKHINIIICCSSVEKNARKMCTKDMTVHGHKERRA